MRKTLLLAALAASLAASLAACGSATTGAVASAPASPYTAVGTPIPASVSPYDLAAVLDARCRAKYGPGARWSTGETARTQADRELVLPVCLLAAGGEAVTTLTA